MNRLTQGQDPLADTFEFKDSVVLFKKTLEMGGTWGAAVKEGYPHLLIRDLKNSDRLVYFQPEKSSKGLWKLYTHMNVASVVVFHSLNISKQAKTIIDYLILTIKRTSQSYKIANLVEYKLFFYMPTDQENSQLSSMFKLNQETRKNCFGHDLGDTYKEFYTVLNFDSNWDLVVKKDPEPTFQTTDSGMKAPFKFEESPSLKTPFEFGKPAATSTFDAAKPTTGFSFTPSTSVPSKTSSSTFNFGTQNSNAPLFGAQTSTPMFGSQTSGQSSASVFGSPSSQSTSVFGSQPQTNNLFGSQSTPFSSTFTGFGTPSGTKQNTKTNQTESTGFKFF